MSRTSTLLLVAFLLLTTLPAMAQPDVSLGGTAFGDYYYVLSAPDEDEEGMNGFTIRRLYLTADFDLSKGFTGRARLEANAGTVGNRGMDAFVKDLYLRWTSAGGHAVRVGIIPVPHWEDSAERVWGYRSLEATVMDFFGVSSSRDMGVRVDGPLLDEGRLDYTLMVGNNNSVRPEDDRGKRVYGALVARPAEHFVLSASADYAGYTDVRENGITLHAFAGYEGERVSVGVEPFWNRLELENDSEAVTSGVSLFAHVTLVDQVRAIGRVDLVELSEAAGDEGTLGIFAISYEPLPNVRLMPNVWVLKYGGDGDPTLQGRFTFEFSF